VKGTTPASRLSGVEPPKKDLMFGRLHAAWLVSLAAASLSPKSQIVEAHTITCSSFSALDAGLYDSRFHTRGSEESM